VVVVVVVVYILLRPLVVVRRCPDGASSHPTSARRLLTPQQRNHFLFMVSLWTIRRYFRFWKMENAIHVRVFPLLLGEVDVYPR
jgi:hypothetical protein